MNEEENQVSVPGGTFERGSFVARDLPPFENFELLPHAQSTFA